MTESVDPHPLPNRQPPTLAAKWQAFVSVSSLRRLGRDAAVVSAISLVARVIGFVREIVVAASFGLASALDIYIVATVFICVPVAVLINAVQPAFIAVVASDPVNSRRRLLLNTVASALACLLAFLPIWLWALPHLFPFLAAAFPPEKHVELRTAVLWAIPYYCLNATSLLCYSWLQAKRRYAANGLIPILTPIVTIGSVLLIGPLGDWRVLMVALAIGMALETAMLGFLLLRASGDPDTSRREDSAALRRVVAQTLVLIPGTLLISTAPMVEQAIAAALGDGTNAALNYGYKLPSAFVSLSAVAVGITALPYFAGQLAAGQYRYCLHSLDKAGRWLFGIALLLPLVFVPFSDEIVRLLYARGEFDAAAVARVAPVQSAYFVQVPFSILAILGLRTLSALRRNGAVSAFSAIVFVFQSIIAWSLGAWIGASGIAWAGVFGSAALAALAFGRARHLLRELAR